jgi:hypothetical protein
MLFDFFLRRLRMLPPEAESFHFHPGLKQIEYQLEALRSEKAPVLRHLFTRFRTASSSGLPFSRMAGQACFSLPLSFIV